MNRRDLLKFFGIGTVIAPVVGGAVNTQHAAQLIEVPKLIAAPVEPLNSRGIPLEAKWDDVDILVRALDRKTGDVMIMRCDAYGYEHRISVTPADITRCGDTFRRFTAVGPARIEMKASGILFPHAF